MVEVFSGIGEGAFLCANRGFLEVDIIEEDLKVQGLRVGKLHAKDCFRC